MSNFQFSVGDRVVIVWTNGASPNLPELRGKIIRPSEDHVLTDGWLVEMEVSRDRRVYGAHSLRPLDPIELLGELGR